MNYKKTLYELYKETGIDYKDEVVLDRAIKLYEEEEQKVCGMMPTNSKMLYELNRHQAYMHNNYVISDFTDKMLSILPVKLRAKRLAFIIADFANGMAKDGMMGYYYDHTCRKSSNLCIISGLINSRQSDEVIYKDSNKLDALRKQKIRVMRNKK